MHTFYQFGKKYRPFFIPFQSIFFPQHVIWPHFCTEKYTPKKLTIVTDPIRSLYPGSRLVLIGHRHIGRRTHAPNMPAI